MSQTSIKTLTEDQISAYKRQARKTLVGSGYNLFAEITLQLIEHHYALLAAGPETGYALTEPAQATIELKAQVQALELERRRLQAQVEHLEREVKRLQRKQGKRPPSLM